MVTVAGLAFSLVGRGVFLRQRAIFHEREHLRCSDLALEVYETHQGNQSPGFKSFEELLGPDDAAKIRELLNRSLSHLRAGKACRHAIYRPWEYVNETTFWAEPPVAQNAAKSGDSGNSGGRRK